MDAKTNSSFAAKIKKGVRSMRSTFKVLCLIFSSLISSTLEEMRMTIGNGLGTSCLHRSALSQHVKYLVQR